jgi:hypothetical protein
MKEANEATTTSIALVGGTADTRPWGFAMKPEGRCWAQRVVLTRSGLPVKSSR